MLIFEITINEEIHFKYAHIRKNNNKNVTLYNNEVRVISLPFKANYFIVSIFTKSEANIFLGILRISEYGGSKTGSVCTPSQPTPTADLRICRTSHTVEQTGSLLRRLGS